MSLTSQINNLIRNRPQYSIANEYGQNIGLASGKAFGRNRTFALKDQQLEQDAADTAYQGQNLSTSSSGLLNMLAAVNKNKVAGMNQNAMGEAQFQAQGLGDLMGANVGLAEEKDKAWNYNVNEPYQLKLNELVQKRKFRQGLLLKGLDALGSVATLGLSRNMFSGKSGGDSSINPGWGGDIG